MSDAQRTEDLREALQRAAAYEQAEEARRIANCDMECWVKDRIRTAISMSLSVLRHRAVQADAPLSSGAIEGIINGAAVEIIRTLGMEPEFVNLDPPEEEFYTSPYSTLYKARGELDT